jgi:glycine dehydrogenase
MAQATLTQLEHHDAFVARHIGPSDADIQQMLQTLGLTSLDELTQQVVPNDILKKPYLTLGPSLREEQALAQLKKLAKQNQVAKQYIGLGYHDTLMPAVIQRNVLENPGWYTAYTPYQAEIAQGRLEALLNFQQMVIDLTGLEIANASLLDEATAAAEAMAMSKRCTKHKSMAYFVDEEVLPQTLDVVKTRADYFGFELIVGPYQQAADAEVFGALFQYPSKEGAITDFSAVIDSLHQRQAMVTLATDLVALALLKSPGEMNADIAIGNAQRFGVPLGFGGPHAAFFATLAQHKRSLPGRIIGVSKDRQGRPALRMALQTREQHIRRENANSNICTAQALLANLSSFYAVYHGPKGIKRIAQRIHRYTQVLAHALVQQGIQIKYKTGFDTLTITTDQLTNIQQRALAAQINLRYDNDQQFGLSISEVTSREDILELINIISGQQAELNWDHDPVAQSGATDSFVIPNTLQRTSDYLTHPVFNQHHCEHEMLRYMKSLENKDLALNHSMISLGSCTMKLNATAEMMPITWPELANIHPFAPKEQTQGYEAIINELEAFLTDITGFDAVCMQPNSGAQGEYAGLLAIRGYQASINESHRNICLIPKSAHGTNPASAQMAGLKVVVVNCDQQGNVDLEDLQDKLVVHQDALSCIMITYPSTHGVFETDIKTICQWVHEKGGQVYMDGANLNAQVGLTQAAAMGADVSHINLHKTFAIPHGGGGPGMGPIGIKSHLKPFVPNHSVRPISGASEGQGAVCSAPYGSASILPISWMYIRMMGDDGLRKATQVALLNANYIAHQLKEHFPILYTGQHGRVAHECILDLRPFKQTANISEVDIAKRLMDYGFHAPTMSFPVAGTFMVEPTESEPKQEIDRFIKAMLSIHAEIKQVQTGALAADDNPLINAPHSLQDLHQPWTHAYSIAMGCFPTYEALTHKFWPSVNRVDDVYGDRNLICSCPPLEDYV